MKVLVIACNKGGVGKTTLTERLSAHAPGKVAIMDMDPQGSLADWFNDRPAPLPHFHNSTLPQLKAKLQELKAAGYDLCVIDTPPQVTDTIRAVISLANLVLIPTLPAPDELRKIGNTILLCEQAGKPWRTVLNRASPRMRNSRDSRAALKMVGNHCPVALMAYEAVNTAKLEGLTIDELPGKAQDKARLEMAALWKWVNGELWK